MEAKIIEKFTQTLVVAVCDCVRPVADACMVAGLITGDKRGDILDSTVTSKDKTRMLLEAVKNCTEIDSESFDIFLRILREKLPERCSSKLLTDMGTELASKQGQTTELAGEQRQATPVEASTALVSSDHEAMGSAHHSQLVIHVLLPHSTAVSRLHQEQNPYMGKLEESIREHERTIAEKKLLKEKLEENERLKAQLADMQSLQSSSASENQSTTTSTSMSETDKIGKLEQKAKELDGEISRYRCAIDTQGDKIIEKLMEEQEKFKNQYEWRFQELVMKYRELERKHGKLDPEEVSVMNYRESEREALRYYGSSDSSEGSDNNVPISKQRKTESSIESLENKVTNTISYAYSSVEQLNRPSLRDILMEIGTSGVQDYEIMERWEDIGIQLEIADEELAEIRRKHTTSTIEGVVRHDSDQAFRYMIRFWTKQVDPQPTWSKFVEALERLNIVHKLTDQLRSKYFGSSPNSKKELNQDNEGSSPNSKKELNQDNEDCSSIEQLNRPSLKEILMEINTSDVNDYEIMERWEDIGIQLDIADEELAEIRRKHTTSTIEGVVYHDSDQAFRYMIRFWVKQVDPPPTWSKFVEALEHLNRFHKLTDRLKSKYCAFCRPLLKEIMLEYSSSSDKEEADEHWDDIGIQLEIDDEKLGEIRRSTARDGGCREAFKHMIRAWMMQKKPQPTWLNLVEALEHLDVCKNLSAHLRLKYCSPKSKNELNQDDKASPFDQQLLINEMKESPDKMEAEEYWDDIGIQLQIVDETLEDISSESLSYEGSFQRMVRAWMKQEKPQPTWTTFVEALEELNICKNLSIELRSKFCLASGFTKNEQELMIKDPQNVGSSPAEDDQRDIKLFVPEEKPVALLPGVKTALDLKEEPLTLEGEPHALLSVIQREIKEEAVPMTETEIMSVQPTTATWNLCGVEVCGEMTVVVYSSCDQQITWPGYGLRLNIPKGCLPAGMEQCTINIKASLAGQYDFPENSHLVSAIFWLRCEDVHKFTKPITVEIQHCAKSENIADLKLSFVRAVCSQEQLPYTFKQLPGGNFNSHSSYGVIELNSFSGVGATQEGSKDREYCSQLFYLGPNLCNIHFVVSWNVEAHLTEVMKKYEKDCAIRGPHQPVEFEADAISLDIPMKGLSIKGWKITPLIRPVVTKKQVDNFREGKLTPCCQLLAEISGDKKKVPTLKYQVNLKGAKYPNDIFVINLPAGYPISQPAEIFGDLAAVGSQGPPPSKRSKLDASEPSASGASTAGPPSASGLDTKLNVNTNHYNVASYLRRLDDRQIRYVGGALGLAFSTLDKMREVPSEVAAAWLLRQDNVMTLSGEPTWRSLVFALRKEGHEGTARDIEDKEK